MQGIRSLHWGIGFLAFATFLGTGMYMRLGMHHPEHLDQAGHLLFRSCHIYILFSAVANLLLGVYFAPRKSRFARTLQFIGSALILSAPFFAITAFCVEPHLVSFGRPWTQPTLYSIFAGVMLHVLSGCRREC